MDQQVPLSPRVYRRERIRELTEDIDNLSVRYNMLPPGRVQASVYDEIESKYDQIRELNAPHFFERPTGQRIAMTLSLALIVFGWMFSGGVLTFGIFVLCVTVLGYMRSPETDPKNSEIWKP